VVAALVKGAFVLRAYGYVRISRDEDGKRESIGTQKKLVCDYAVEQDIDILKVFEDNNISGYSFEREGLAELKKLIEVKKVDILIAKDLSRIGRHNAKTLLFLDYLDDHGVRLVLLNDNYDSKVDDDTTIGIKTWYNEMYLKDLSRKIKANIRQKQKEGLVIVPHYGYMKDPCNPKKIVIDHDVADTIRLIFQLYISGLGCNKISHYLNDNQIETPSIHKMKKFGFGWKPDWTQKELWYASSIKRILTNDAYIGTLRCGITKLSRMKGKKVNVPEEEHFVFEEYFPTIIDKKDYELVQRIMKSRVNNNVRAKNQKIHRYAGILKCGECGKGFVSRISTLKNGTKRIAYVCATFHRYRSEHCTSHRIFEEEIDNIVVMELNRLLLESKGRLTNLDNNVHERINQRKDFDKSLQNVRLEIEKKKIEIKNYSRQLAKGMITDDIFEEMVSEANQDLIKMEGYQKELQSQKESSENEKEYLVDSIKIIEDVLNDNKLTNADIVSLIDKISVYDTDEIGLYGKNKVRIEIEWRL